METSTSGELTEFLQAQMLKYQTSQLVGVRPDEFRKDIEAFLHPRLGYVGLHVMYRKL